MEMTDNEIIKALECCSNPCGNDCDECPKFVENYDTIIECGVFLMADALSLINRQKAEIESLNSRIFALNDTNKILMDSQEVYWRNKVKEFAVRLKEMVAISEDREYRSGYDFSADAVFEDIDNLVKEMVGDTE